MSRAHLTPKEYQDLIDVPEGPVILNIHKHHFSTMRNGDLLAVCNMIAYLRKREKRQDIFAHVMNAAINPQPYNYLFRDFLIANSGYLSATPGVDFHIPHVSIWDYRGGVGDHIAIDIPRTRVKKIAIFPLWDAAYNTYRNWQSSPRLSQEIINRFSEPKYKAYEKVICTLHELPGLDYKDFQISRDFHQNIEHILTCMHYVGGDSGLSHFAGSLEHGPHLHYYMHGERGVFHSAPLNYLKRGELLLYS